MTFLAIARKEFFHILRDPGTLLLVTLGPLFLMVVFAYALTSEVKNAPIAVLDEAGNSASAALISRLDESDLIHVAARPNDTEDIDHLLLTGEVRAVIRIPSDYGRITLQEMPTVEAIVDGTEPVSAEVILEETYAIADAHNRTLAEAQFGSLAAAQLEQPIQVEAETLYNPELRSIVDFYPGLAAIMLTLPAIALALSLARESESGTLEQLVATPLNKRALLGGKLLPYLLFGMADVYALLLMGHFVYDVPFRGNLLEYSLVALLFMLANLGLALVIAVLVRSQQLAMIVAMLLFFVPPFFLSGIFFPIDAMPLIVQIELWQLPSTHFVELSKAIYLQGTSITEMLFPFIFLIVLGIEFIEIAVFIFRKKVTIDFSFAKLIGRQRNADTIPPSTSIKSQEVAG